MDALIAGLLLVLGLGSLAFLELCSSLRGN